jgi:DNA-binding response OmpR family regulator
VGHIFRAAWQDRESHPAGRTGTAMTRTSRILVADHDALLRELLEYKLSARGYDVLTAEDGEGALALIRAERPDLVVLDAMMPVRDGFDVLRQMKLDAEVADIPVVMLTARKQESDIVGALDLGAADYLVKPFNPEELLARIARIIAMNRR